jgi:hypothetical protein
MPVLLGNSAFAPLTMESMRSVAMGSLIGHLIFGLVLGGCYVAITKKGGRHIHMRETDCLTVFKK